MPKKRLIIIDAHALIHRAWHALPPLKTKDGVLVNAVYGFTSILLRVLKDLKATHIAVAFDRKEKTLRKLEFAEYKAGRVKQPDEFYAQIPIVKKVVETFDMPIFEKVGYEADDLIGAVCKKLDPKSDIETIIVTGDLDTLQLVDDNTKVYTLKKGISDTILYDEQAVKERFNGLGPKQIVDLKALAGDASDNIPGVRGIGEVSAINLLNEFGVLDNIYDYLKKHPEGEKIKEKTRELLLKYQNDAYMSRKLATIVTDLDFDFDLSKCEFHTFDREKVAELFHQLEFKSLLNKIPEDPKRKQLAEAEDLPSKKDYHLIDNEPDFEKFFQELKKQKNFAFDTETTSLDPLQAKLLGISFSWQDGHAYFLSRPTKEQLKKLQPIFEDKKIGKYGHNLKFDIEVMEQAGIKTAGLAFDTMIASYLINPGSRAHNLDKVVFTELGLETTPIEKLIGKKGKKQLPMEMVNPHQLCQYSCEDADMTYRLVEKLKPQLEEKSIIGLFAKVEMPLIPVLAEMETNGIKVESKKLAKLAKEVDARIKELEKKIYREAGSEFNINSPLQMKEILFNKLQISSANIKKGKTGLSTAADELEKMKDAHPIIPLIIEYRELAKLSSTYIDALPKLINQKTGRVHTSYNQAVTATGRLSSSEPNLQNIPIRTELGEKIREAFVAEDGYELLSIDYSQIELRIVASLARDEKMMQAFRKGEDIHTRTAAEVFGVPADEVTKNQRRDAKAVNFGVIYGMGAFGLAQGTGLSRHEAQLFIDKYFQIHQGIKKYLEETKDLARGLGYVETLFGRRRYLPDLNANAPMIRSAAERAAVNHPIQGTAADLMKMAMIEVSEAIKKEFKDDEIRILLQVHDSLIFEVKKNKLQQAAKLIKDKMENVVKLRVPVEVDVEVGENWGEMEKIKI